MFTALEIATLIVGVLLAQVTPGPNMMAVSSYALGAGRRAGVLVAAGVASGVFVWAVSFAFGIGAILKMFPATLVAMKLIGGLYLLFMAARAIRSAFRPASGGAARAVARSSGTRAYLVGVLVVLTNPKAALMWVAISMFLASHGSTTVSNLIVGICATGSAMAVYGAYAYLFSTDVAMRSLQTAFSQCRKRLFGDDLRGAGRQADH